MPTQARNSPMKRSQRVALGTDAPLSDKESETHTARALEILTSLQAQRAKWSVTDGAIPAPSPDQVSRAREHALRLKTLAPEVEEGAFVARCLEIPGVFGRGVTKEDALKTLRERATERLAFILAAGGELPKEGKPSMPRVKKSFDLPSDLHDNIHSLRHALNLTFGDVVVAALRLWVDEQEKARLNC